MDDHLRNHGFLYDSNNQWRLSPAYDLNPVPSAEKTRELTTWISEEGPEADLDLARRAARHFNLKDDHADAIINDVTNRLNGWQNFAHQLGMSAADIGVYETAFLIK